MGKDFYQDRLAASPESPTPVASSPTVRPRDVPGLRLATALHLLVLLGGPLAIAFTFVLTLVGERDPRPLVRGTATAIWHFHLALAVVALVGIVLVVARSPEWGAVPLGLVAAAWLLLPPLAAWRTWRTGRVHRYPFGDLLRPPG